MNIVQYFVIDFVTAYEVGDGCCIEWNSDGTCCLDIYQQCCGESAYGNNYNSDGYYGGDGGYYGGGYYGGGYGGGYGRGYGGGRGWRGVSNILFYRKI